MKALRTTVMLILALALLMAICVWSYMPAMEFAVARPLPEEERLQKIAFVKKIYTPITWIAGKDTVAKMDEEISNNLNGVQVIDPQSFSYRFDRWCQRNTPILGLVYLVVVGIGGSWLWKKRRWMKQKLPDRGVTQG